MSQSYSFSIRLIHWLTTLIISSLLILGFWMTSRSEANLWDELTNTLYAWHKFLGFTILSITLIRILIKVNSNRPAYPLEIPRWQIQSAQLVQTIMYVLLVLIPLFGWAGVTAYPALEILGGLKLPAMPGIPSDQALAKQLFEIHGILVFCLIPIVLIHLTAGIRHLWLKKDKIFARIWF